MMENFYRKQIKLKNSINKLKVELANTITDLVIKHPKVLENASPHLINDFQYVEEVDTEHSLFKISEEGLDEKDYYFVNINEFKVDDLKGFLDELLMTTYA